MGHKGHPHAAPAALNERRRFFRVPTQMRVDWLPIAPGELEALRQQILTRSAHAAGAIAPELFAVLRRIESKLDRVLTAVESPEAGHREGATGRVTAISGAGMRVVAKDRPPVGEAVLAEFVLPGDFAPIRAIADVVRHIEPHEPGDEPELAFSFRAIHETDREAIVHFSLEVERAARRAVREAGDAG